jgi:hypothetical protein
LGPSTNRMALIGALRVSRQVVISVAL